MPRAIIEMLFTTALNLSADRPEVEVYWGNSEIEHIDLLRTSNGWKPSFVVFSSVTEDRRRQQGWSGTDLLSHFGLDPHHWQIDESSSTANGTPTYDFVGAVEDFVPGQFDRFGQCLVSAEDEE